MLFCLFSHIFREGLNDGGIGCAHCLRDSQFEALVDFIVAEVASDSQIQQLQSQLLCFLGFNDLLVVQFQYLIALYLLFQLIIHNKKNNVCKTLQSISQPQQLLKPSSLL